MPEFEDTNNSENKEANYVPSTDAKPRSRRSSGGFKNDYSATENTSIGEVDPSEVKSETILDKKEAPSPQEATESEAISNESNDSNDSEVSQPNPTPKSRGRDKDRDRDRAAPKSSPRPTTKSAPLGQETLRVIQELEEKIAGKKQAREARRKERPARTYKGKKKAGLLGTLINSIKSLFGIKPKKKYNNNRGRRPNYKNQKRYNKRRS